MRQLRQDWGKERLPGRTWTIRSQTGGTGGTNRYYFLKMLFIYLTERKSAREGTQAGGMREGEAGFHWAGSPTLAWIPGPWGHDPNWIQILNDWATQAPLTSGFLINMNCSQSGTETNKQTKPNAIHHWLKPYLGNSHLKLCNYWHCVLLGMILSDDNLSLSVRYRTVYFFFKLCCDMETIILSSPEKV